MVATVRQIVKVQDDGRLEVLAPELRAGTITEVIVFLPTEPPEVTPAERVAALARLRESVGLTVESANQWANDVLNERDAWKPTSEK